MIKAREFTRGKALYLKKGKRVWEIDALRGFCIILMLFDHAMFDFSALDMWFSNFWYVDNKFFEFMFDFAIYNYWSEGWRITARIIVISTFLFLSGISGVFSKNNTLRAGKLCAAAIALSCVTILLDDFGDFGLTIIFGILHCLALCVVVYAILKALLKDNAKYAFLGFGLLICLYSVTFDFYNIPLVKDVDLKNFIDIVLGFKGYGSDYFGIFPYMGVFLLGAYAGEIFYSDKKTKLPRLDKAWKTPLCFVGRNTIWVYLLHQPIILGIIILLGLAVGYAI